MLRRKTTTPGPRTGPTKFDRMPSVDLETALETALQETARLFRGVTHREIDQEWLLAQMEQQIQTALQAVQALRRKL